MIAVEQLQISAGSFALRDVTFTLPSGSYGVLMGRTGQGKTTLLEAICGLRNVHGGRIQLDDDDVTNWPPARRNVGFVPQDAALFSHLNVRDQLGFSLIVRKIPKNEIHDRVSEVADWLGISHLLDRSIAGLSGGEIQRVAVGRAIAFRPRVLCLDEPLSALDEDTRDSMCDVLQSVQSRTRVTVLHITHNRQEAERLADCVLHLDDGRIENRNN